MSAASLRSLEARLIPEDQREEDAAPEEVMPDDAVDRANGADEDTVPNGTRSEHDSQMDRSVSSSGMRKREKWYTVSLLTLTAAMLYADQNLLAPNLSAAAEEFGFSEREKKP